METGSKKARTIEQDTLLRRVSSWDDIPPEWQKDPGIALAAWQRLLVTERNKVPCLTDDVFRAAVEKEELEWIRLPWELRVNEDFVRSLAVYSRFAVRMGCHNFPQLRQERGFWKTVINSNIRDLPVLIKDLAPTPIRADRELMMTACKQNQDVLRFIADHLKVDRSFLETVLQSNALALTGISTAAQQLYPDLVEQCLQPFGQDFGCARKLATYLVPGLRNDRVFGLAWFRSGLPFLPWAHPNDWRMDKEIFLLIAEHSFRRVYRDSFLHVSSSLRDDRTFMTQALQLQPALLQFASMKLRLDFELLVLAFSTSRDATSRYFQRAFPLDIPYDEMVHRVDEKLQLYDVFVKTLLYGMSSSAQGGALSVLNQGEDTSRSYKELIASYLGVPMGKELQILRRAAANLASLG